jgi:CrcB protein
MVQQALPGNFPFGTLAANLLGCFLFGLIWQMAEQRVWLDTETRLILLVGFMGAFTTYSSFAFETHSLASTGHLPYALANIAANLIGGWLAVAAGIGLGGLFK